MKTVKFLITLLLSLIFTCCDSFLCDPEDQKKQDSLNTESTLRFNPLDMPIEGKLYFVAGPTSTTRNDSFYNHMPWDFWKLEGTEFIKLNETSWPYNYSGHWNFQFSPNASYFSFFDDKGGPVSNTDDIGLLNLSNFTEYYFTDSLGDANPSDEWIYQWDSNEEYIYFNSIQFGISEYNTLANSDLYRVSPNNYLEQLTNTPYFEVGVNPSPDGKYLAYFIEHRNASPDSLVGLHLLDLESMESKLVYSILANKPDHLNSYPYFNSIWNLSGEYFLAKIAGDFFKYDINNNNLEYLSDGSFGMLFFIPHSNQLIVSRYNRTTEKRELGVYDLDTKELTTFPITLKNYAQNPWDPPTISPSGRYLAFTAYEDIDQYRQQFALMNSNIYIVDLSDYSITQITTGWSGYEGYLKWVE